jgi:hypothetical protein
MSEMLSGLKLLMPSSIDILDFIQIVIICVALYYCVKTIKGTRAWILAKGLAVIGFAYLFFYATGMSVLQYILQSLLSGLMVAIVIMIQPELQKIVEKIGTNKFSDIKPRDLISETPAGIKNIAIFSRKKLLTSFISFNFIILYLSNINSNIIPIILPGIIIIFSINELIYSPIAHKPNIIAN